MQYSLQIFQTEDHHSFRTYAIDGEPWFSLADVCEALSLKAHKRSYAEHAAKLDEDERRRVSPDFAKGMPGSDPGMYTGQYPVMLVNESGLYTLVLRSDKAEAKRFKKWITSEVLPSIRRTGGYGRRTPAFIKRFNENWDRVTPGFFSVINELVVRLHGRLEMVGHLMADRAPDGKEIRPDGSVGRLFADWLRLKHPTVCGEFSYYIHKTDQWEGQVRQYPMKLLPLYIQYVDTIWIPEHSPRYFKTRDAAALPHLPKLLPLASRGRPGAMRGLSSSAW